MDGDGVQVDLSVGEAAETLVGEVVVAVMLLVGCAAGLGRSRGDPAGCGLTGGVWGVVLVGC